jgi:hypothetical protein
MNDALQQAALIASIGLLVTTLEELSTGQECADTGFLSWQVSRVRRRWTAAGRLGSLFDLLLRYRTYRILLVASLLAAALAPVTLVFPRLLGPLAFSILSLSILRWIRTPWGRRGADHMNLVVFSAVFLSTLTPEGSPARTACAWFVALQACLAYFAAGVAKLISPPWRCGGALIGISSLRSHGCPPLYGMLRQRPGMARVLSWGTIAFECLFWLVLFLDFRGALVVLGLGVVFHASVAVCMGLNDFFWAFSATYPVVLACSQRVI